MIPPVAELATSTVSISAIVSLTPPTTTPPITPPVTVPPVTVTTTPPVTVPPVTVPPPTTTPPVTVPPVTVPPPTTTPTPTPEEYGMQIGGYVWNDGKTEGKDQKTNGAIDAGEEYLEGILVSLYEVDSSGNLKLADLITNTGMRSFGDSENCTTGQLPSTNPTITDKTGYYIFKNVSLNKKYVVAFTYNGVDYISTATNENTRATLSEYNTDRWIKSSKGTELIKDRSRLNSRFVTVGSTPNNYLVKEPIFGDDLSYLSKETNGNYNREFLESELKNIKEEVYKQEIYAIRHKKSISLENNNYIKNVYRPIIDNHRNNLIEIKQQLQYLYDCKIKSYAGYNSEEGGTSSVKQEYYPVYDNILLSYQYIGVGGNKKNDSGSFDYNLGQQWKKDAEMEYPYADGKGYGYIYIGQYYINQGLLKRSKTNVSLSQDLYKTVVSINKKDEEYKYGTLSEKKLTVDDADFTSKADENAKYSQNISADDYNYKTATQTLDKVASYDELKDKIQIYATYKISIKNLSNIPTSINEVVTYFDRKYLSYNDYYTTTAKKQITGMTATYGYDSNKDITGEVQVNEHSKYGTQSETLGQLELNNSSENDYTDLYLTFKDNGILLENNASITIYITYMIGSETPNKFNYSKFKCTYNNEESVSAEKILQDKLGSKDNGGKSLNIETITEINSFSTFYKKTSDSEEIQSKYKGEYKYFNNQYRAAGVLDGYSIPGNLDKEQISYTNQHSGRAKEHDWDYAPTLVLNNPGGTRKITGNVWETGHDASYYLKNSSEYPRYDTEEKTIEGITVELIEIKEGKQYVRAVTSTNSQGEYIITGYVAGNYVIRFVYGDKVIYDTYQYSEKEDIMNGTRYKYPYNGEFYQSARSNPNTNKEVVENNNNTRFWYAYEEKDKDNKTIKYSDAYDEADKRMSMNSKFANGYVYAEAIDTIVNPREYMMYANTALMEIYPEKARTNTPQNISNPSYEINNVDFALTPRTQTKLNITKEVSNIKLILQNGKVQFDATPETIRKQGVSGVVQVGKGSTINISMSNELISGATIEITYKITAKNESEYDSVRYYYDKDQKVIALALYEEPYTEMLTYEKNYTEYDSQEDKIVIRDRNLIRTYETYERVNEMEVGISKLQKEEKERIEVTTTTPEVVADYVPGNLNFTHIDSTGRTINNGWEIYQTESGNIKNDFINKYYEAKTTNSSFADIDSTEVYDANTVIISTRENPLITTKLSAKGKKGEEGGTSSAYITLSKVIANENGMEDIKDIKDTKQYKNKVRIVSINNSESRIQDLNSSEKEIKLKAESENVTITDPTGENRGYLIITMTIIAISIIGIGTVLIKKFVLK